MIRKIQTGFVGNRGFSLIELLIVTSILVILASLFSPTFTKIKENAQTTECKVNLKAIHQAIILYTQDFDNYLPGPSGERTGPHFRKDARFNKSGVLRKRFQRFAFYLSPYMTSKSYDDEFNYIPNMICPANEDRADLVIDPQIRNQYSILNPPGVNKPFGDHSRTRKSDGKFIAMKLPKTLAEITSPSDTRAMKDVRDPDKKWVSVPDLPVHQEFRENVLFFDGSVETQEVNNL